jgi:hypothetical protein
VNAEPDANVDQAVSQIHEVMKYRAERVVFVSADPGVARKDVLALMERVWNEAEVISIVTPKIGALAQRRICLTPSRETSEKLPRYKIPAR